jgi:hypothetical protein
MSATLSLWTSTSGLICSAGTTLGVLAGAALLIAGGGSLKAQPVTLIDFTNSVWAYDDTTTASANYDGFPWYSPALDGSAWKTGNALFGNDSTGIYDGPGQPFSGGINGFQTALDRSGDRITFYFRTTFNWPGGQPTAGVILHSTNYVDDGCVIYLNGTEVGRIRLPNPPSVIAWSTLAQNPLGEGVPEYLELPSANLVAGANLLAVEVHQSSSASSDVAWAMKLVAESAPTTPVITAQPTNFVSYVGGAASFTVTATGSAPLNYQWHFNGTTAIAGATNATLVLSDVQLSNAGSYSVTINNSIGSATSQLAALTVLMDVTLPGDPIVASSSNTPGSEGAASAIDNTLTKYLNFDTVNTGFTVNPVARGLTIVSGLTLTSANDAPERDPADYILSGSNDGQTFTQISSGSVPSFPSRFYKNAILFNNAAAYLQYRLIFPNVVGPGAVAMQIAEVELLGMVVPPSPPSITVQPQSRTNQVGDTAVFSVAASGSPPLTYRWLKNGVNIPGAANQTLELPLIQAGDNGSIYTASVSNALGTATSDGATLTVVTAQHQNGVSREVYLGIDGATISALTNDASFPNNPSYTDIQPTFEAPVGFAETYGQRMRALLVPPATGDYTFWISSDDASVLYLSTDETAVNKYTIASVSTWTSFGEWTKETNQQSAPIALNAGQRYYIEALHKEGGGGDHVTVRWRLPDNTIEEPIPGERLRAFGPSAVSITGQPASRTSVVGASANFSVEAIGAPPLAFQWYFNQTILIPGATNPTLSLSNVQMADAGGYSVVISNAFGSVTSSVAVLTVSGGPAFL